MSVRARQTGAGPHLFGFATGSAVVNDYSQGGGYVSGGVTIILVGDITRQNETTSVTTTVKGGLVCFARTNGKHYDCTGTSASWTAKLGG
jgi:hypothetical protein